MKYLNFGLGKEILVKTNKHKSASGLYNNIMLAFPGLLWLIVFITLCCSSQSSFFLLCSFTHVVYCKLFTHSMDGRHGDGSWMWWRESQVFLFGFSGVCVRMRVSRCFLCFGGKIPPLLRTSPTRPIYLFQTSSHPDTFT